MIPGGALEKIAPVILAVIGAITLIIGLTVGLSGDNAGSSSKEDKVTTTDGLTIKDGSDKVTIGKDGVIVVVDKGDETVTVDKGGVHVKVDENDAQVDVAVEGTVLECLDKGVQDLQEGKVPTLWDFLGALDFGKTDTGAIKVGVKCPGQDDITIVDVEAGGTGPTKVDVNA